MLDFNGKLKDNVSMVDGEKKVHTEKEIVVEGYYVVSRLPNGYSEVCPKNPKISFVRKVYKTFKPRNCLICVEISVDGELLNAHEMVKFHSFDDRGPRALVMAINTLEFEENLAEDIYLFANIVEANKAMASALLDRLSKRFEQFCKKCCSNKNKFFVCFSR